ncbi:MAG: TolB-like 6-bladed beta-propeller domain-containing protein [Bacteroidales bacterium]|nr:TolB-like 6-bladed beta-propeller domain-containing protein [Bacteroidales bacterium]
MRSIIASFLLLFLLLSFGTCGHNKQFHTPANSSTLKNFSASQTLEEVEFIRFDTLSPDGLLLYHDTVLIIRNTSDNSTHHFTSINLNSRELIGKHLEAGFKTGQSMDFLSYGIVSSNLWVYDLRKQKVILNPILHSEREASESNELALTSFYYSIQMDSDSTIIGSGNYESDYKQSRLKLTTVEDIDELIPYAKSGSKKLSREDKMANESFLSLKPSADKCVLAARYADQIEIVDLESRESIIVKGAEGFEADVSFMTGFDGAKLMARNANTRFAAVRVKTTDNYIYVLFSGSKEQASYPNFGKNIYVYDWDGTAVKQIKLQDYLNDFVVTKDDTRIYTYNPQTKLLKTAEI